MAKSAIPGGTLKERDSRYPMIRLFRQEALGQRPAMLGEIDVMERICPSTDQTNILAGPMPVYSSELILEL